MRLVVQRVRQAQVTVEKKIVGKIAHGMLIFLAVGHDDAASDIDYLIKKILELRIFDDANGKMNLSCRDAKGEFLVVSEFTLLGDCRKGRRPSFDAAAEPKRAEELYNQFVEKLRAQNVKAEAGVFRAMMDVSLVNDGPVTFILDSKND